MFAKLHQQIFKSSIMEADLKTRYVWFCLLALADEEGFIDSTIQAIAREINVETKIVEDAIAYLEKPDKSSRTPDFEGRRLIKIRESFGWQIVNYVKYRNLKNKQERKEYMKNYMKSYRVKQTVDDKHLKNKDKNKFVNTCKQSLTKLTHTEAEEDTDTLTTPKGVEFSSEHSHKQPNELEVVLDTPQKQPKPKRDVPAHTVLKFFQEEHQKVFGQPVHVQWAKDTKLAKSLIATFGSPERVCELVAKFLRSDDDFIAKSGFNFGVFSACVNKFTKSPVKTVPNDWIGR